MLASMAFDELAEQFAGPVLGDSGAHRGQERSLDRNVGGAPL